MSDDPYVYPGSTVLRNRFGLMNQANLDRIERLHTSNRSLEPIPRGKFDLTHLRAIHRHLFQDVYDWAGELRTVEISKGRKQFQFRQYIQTGMADVHRRLERTRFLRALSAADFAAQAAVIIGDINYIHPFRDGNGRTQLQYLNWPTRRAIASTLSGSRARAGSRRRSQATQRTTSRWRGARRRPRTPRLTAVDAPGRRDYKPAQPAASVSPPFDFQA